MQKETITLSNIQQDLSRIALDNLSNTEEWRFSYIVPATLLAVIIGILLKNIWIGLLIFSLAAYHLVRYIMEYKKYKDKENAIRAIIDRGDISISVETFSHIAEEPMYEPHWIGKRGAAIKMVKFYHFQSGCSWRVPYVGEYYKWSKDFHLSLKGLENISISGDEFYHISLQGHYDIAYIYPCKNFMLDSNLKLKD